MWLLLLLSVVSVRVGSREISSYTKWKTWSRQRLAGFCRFQRYRFPKFGFVVFVLGILMRWLALSIVGNDKLVGHYLPREAWILRATASAASMAGLSTALAMALLVTKARVGAASTLLARRDASKNGRKVVSFMVATLLSRRNMQRRWCIELIIVVFESKVFWNYEQRVFAKRRRHVAYCRVIIQK